MKILIISDGRPGHYNQSVGIVSHIKDVEFYLIEVKFRSKRRDNLLRILMRFLGWMPMPEGFIIRLLNMALSQESAGEILTCEDYDIILSTGSSVAPINLLMGKLINAYTVVCTCPSPLGIAYFDLAILPQHHWPRINRKNVCKTLGVPNLITPEDTEQRRVQLQSKLNLPDKSRIGVLLGGEDRYFTITQATASKLLDTLLKVCDKIDGQLALTTSRRTPQVVEELVHSRLDAHDRCVLLELASGTYPRSLPAAAVVRGLNPRTNGVEPPHIAQAGQGKLSNIPDTVASIFAISDIVIVTEDSFSMVCEATSSGRKVIILDVDRKSNQTFSPNFSFQTFSFPNNPLTPFDKGERKSLNKKKSRGILIKRNTKDLIKKKRIGIFSLKRPRRHRTYDSIMQSTQAVRCNIDNLEEMLLKIANEDVKCKALRDAKKAAIAIIQILGNFDY